MKYRGRVRGKVGAIFLALAFSCVLLNGCKTESRAADAAKQLDTVSGNLAAYYDELETQMDATITLNEVQSAMDKIPFGPDDRATMLDVKSEIGKRADMARALDKLADAYGKLAGSKAGADAGAAASELANDLATAKAMPQGAKIPDVCGDAAKLLVDFVQTRDLKKGSAGVSKAVTAVSEIFDGEKAAYESIEKQRLALARQISVKLVDHHQIQINYEELMEPATKPFKLTPKPQDVNDDPAYVQLVKSEIEAQVQEQVRAYADATDRLGASLHAVRDAVDKVRK